MSFYNPLVKGVNKGFKANPRLTVTEWSDKYRVLTSEASAEAGRWRTDRTPYLKEIMDVLSPNDPTQQVKAQKGTQLGFALDIATLLPTPKGFATMGNIQIGDYVLGSNGQPCRVINKSEVFTKHNCFKITFDDGLEIVCDAGHKWSLNNNPTLNTITMYNNFKKNKYAVKNTDKVNYSKQKQELPPYFLGVWLGDGKQKGNEIGLNIADTPEICSEFSKLEIPYRLNTSRTDIVILKFGLGLHNICKNGHCNKRDFYGRCVECGETEIKPFAIMSNTLKAMGLQDKKHIPKNYLFGSIEQREELLCGLMDTDGYIGKDKGRCGYDSVNETLIYDVKQLIESLGYKVMIEKSYRVTKFTHGKKTLIYRLRFYAKNYNKVFKLARKKILLKDKGIRDYMSKQRKIINIAEVEKTAVQCISVDSSDHLYLATKSFLPTHNSSLADNLAMCYLDYYPCPILYLLPTETLAKGTSKRRITPSIRAIPHLAKKIIGGKSKDDVGEIFSKAVAGGNLALGWSNSTASFRSFSARVVILDDIDGFGSFGEGDVIELGKARADAFSNKKIYINSTPTIEGISNIAPEFEDSDQREYFMACPHCKKDMIFSWHYMKYETNSKGYLKDDVVCACPHCGGLIQEYQKTSMMADGHWIPQNPGHIHKGYKLTSFYSPYGWLSWNDIAREFIKAHKLMKKGDSRAMQVWMNTRNAEVWKENLEGVEITNAKERVEDYGGEVPNEVLVITAGVDTQDDRFEVEVLGHGRNGETWSIDYQVISGDPKDPETIQALDEYLDSEFTRVDGAIMKIFGAAIDSGGHRTTAIYNYCKPRYHRKIFAIKGSSVLNASITNKRYAPNRTNPNLELFSIGVNSLKDDFYSKLSVNIAGDNYCHFPNKLQYDNKFFKMLTAEKRDPKGRYVKVRHRNEALDTRVYAVSVIHILGIPLNSMRKPLLHIGEVPANTIKETKTIITNKTNNFLDEF